ncbi:MAG: DUF1850 domain-containing protein [Treponema sp.]|nr:DUF1850 domain-containing protein [Treponema sp.]
MTNLPKRTCVLLILTSSLLGLGLVLRYVPLIPCLIVSNVENSQQKIVFDCNKQGRFIISYTHSVNKGRVKDCYFFSKNGILNLEKTIFSSYGAGIPEPNSDEKFVVTEEGLEIQKINKQFKSFQMSVGVEAKHAIECNGKIYYLTRFFPVQTSLKFEYNRVPLALYINRIR